MAKAYSCDRCGELFKQINYEGTVPVVLDNDRELEMSFGNSQVYVSLCPNCRAGFQSWWDEGATCKTTDGKHQINIYEHNEEDENE